MVYDESEIGAYSTMLPEFIPIHTWNKQKKGIERGKTPVDYDWPTREYSKEALTEWIKQGLNIGCRLRKNELVVDVDPRNYAEGVDSEEILANLFGFFDFEDMIDTCPTVKTGGGGYHFYYLLPKGLVNGLLRETLDILPGIEFKKIGRQVLAAGSKHPSGTYYRWLNHGERQIVPEEVLSQLKRKIVYQEYTTGAGSLTGVQLAELVLDKLDIKNYASNDKWFPMLAASHHATGGAGVEEFTRWSISDTNYAHHERTIRERWDSLCDRESSVTVGTLIHELEQLGEDSNGVRATLAFASIGELAESVDDLDTEENEIIRDAKRVAAEIDISDIYNVEGVEQGVSNVDGMALQMANDLHVSCSKEELIKCLRLIKACDSFESMKAQEVLVSRKIMKQSSLNKMLKELDARICDDLALLLANKTLETVFKSGKYLTCLPNGALWAFRKTHWRPMPDEFLAKLIQNVLHIIKQKMETVGNELSLITQAVKLSRIAVATLVDRIHSTDLPRSVINCKNGELWLNRDGSHALKPHNYRTYLSSCLSVDYDPSAKCDLFMDTLRDIFERFEDCEDMIRHMGELLGYMVQPCKNIASWWLFRGPGGDGKSTILKILEGILQDSQLMTDAQILTIGTSTANAHIKNSLVNKLSIIIEELPERYMLKDAALKKLSENTKMEANPKGQGVYSFMYAGTLIMCSNGFPTTRDLSHGMFRRANVIPFSRQFTERDAEGNLCDNVDLDRAGRILGDKKEMSGVLNFMLQGLQRLRDRGGFLEPKSCKAAKTEWMGEANNVVRFINETIDITRDANDCMGDLSHIFGAIYAEWCHENDIDEKMRKRKSHFKRDMSNLGLLVRHGGNNKLKVYGGILKNVNITEEDW